MAICVDLKDVSFMYGHRYDSERTEIPSRDIDMIEKSYPSKPIYFRYKNNGNSAYSATITDLHKNNNGIVEITTEDGTKYLIN